MNPERSLLATAIAVGLAAAMPLQAAQVTSGNDQITVSLSGQVNRALLFTDDGKTSDVHHVDNDASSTRFRIIGEKTSVGTTVGIAIEMQLESNSSFDVSQGEQGDATAAGAGDDITERRLEFYVQDRWGKLWVGQGWTASEDTSEQDLSGTALAGYSDPTILAGGTFFRQTNGVLSDTQVKGVYNNLDGLGRRDRIRYDTPGFAGFVFAASAVQGDAWDASLSYTGEYNGTQVVGAVAYADPDTATANDQFNGSVSLLFENGFNLTFAGGMQNAKGGGDDPGFYYGKAGYQTDLVSAGRSFFSIDYHRSDDVEADGDEATSVGLQALQRFDAWATEAYVGYILYELDRPGVNFEDIHTVIAGARVKF